MYMLCHTLCHIWNISQHELLYCTTCPAGRIFQAVLGLDAEVLKSSEGIEVLQARARSSSHPTYAICMAAAIQPFIGELLQSEKGMEVVCHVLRALVRLSKFVEASWLCVVGSATIIATTAILSVTGGTCMSHMSHMHTTLQPFLFLLPYVIVCAPALSLTPAKESAGMSLPDYDSSLSH